MIKSDLGSLLSECDIILTPTRRLASRLRNDLNTHLAQTQQAWSTPNIHALNDWLQLKWQAFEIQGKIRTQLLTPTQAILKLESIIQHSNEGNQLLRSVETAKTVYEAYKMVYQWHLQHQLSHLVDNVDQATFMTWITTYTDWLKENSYTDEGELPNVLLELLLTAHTPQTIGLYAFEEIHPQFQNFLNGLQQNNWQIKTIDPPHIEPQQLIRMAFNDQRHEWLVCAQWAKELVDQGATSIAIVVPNLPEVRHAIDTIFHDVIHPLSAIKASHEVSSYINLSAAIPLFNYPIVHNAFVFFKSALHKIAREDVVTMLLSPFGKQDIQALAKLLELKGHRQHYFTAQECRCFLPQFQQIIVSHHSQLMSDWIPIFKKILLCFGWPGDRVLSSIEHQVVKRFMLFLDELAMVDQVLSQMNYHDAWQTAVKLATHLPFQPENKQAPIQILGLLEATGQQFDHLWVMGLHAENWPPIAKPNPFISVKMQRLYKMPHAGPERELAYAQQVTNRLKVSAKEIVFSYFVTENERQLMVSELISPLPLVEGARRQNLPPLPLVEGARLPCVALAKQGRAGEGLWEKAEILKAEDYFTENITVENKLDDKAPPITQNEELHSGIAILNLQNQCPFKAFAEIRLKATQEGWQDVWLEPLHKGIIVHKILEAFWRKVKNLNHLQQLSAVTLNEIITTIINKIVEKYCAKETPQSYIDVEKTRLHLLLSDYIQLEKQRPGFVVIATEIEKTFTIADLTFTVRLDRLDMDDEERLLIVDYKTGQFNVSSLWDPRLVNVQLPIYYLAMHNEKPMGLFACKLDLKGCSFEGISSVEIDIPGIKTIDDWDSLHYQWQTKLTQLAIDFQQGVAKVDPLEGQVTCQFCHLKALCRIHDAREPNAYSR